MRVLVINAGSSSIKLSLLGPGDEPLGRRELGARPPEDELAAALRELGEADAVGHRIVHGGTLYREPVVIDEEVERGLRGLVDLAPLHQPKSLDALEAVSRAVPGPPAVACFDTAFHAHMPPAASTYALPAQWRERWGLRRFGFHGLSHAYASRRAAQLLERDRGDLRVVTCHLGAGASLAAVAGGRSVDTTMGFTPLEGLVMATRSGSVDPGLLLWILEQTDLSEREMARALEHDSGLAGLTGEQEMPAVLAAAAEGREDAQVALAVYLHRLRAGIAAMTAAMGGVDALVFTGGVGEHAPEIRAGAADGLGFLGVGLNSEANAQAAGDVEITGTGAAVRALVVTAREDLEIARQTREALRPG